MANYIFENMTAAQAAAFTSSDRLVFLNATAATTGVVFNTSTQVAAETITLASGTQSLSFAATALNAASTGGRLIFVNGDTLLVGTNSDATVNGSSVDADNVLNAGASQVGAIQGSGAAIYGFAGADTITGSVANDTISAGVGDDVIIGSSGGVDSEGNLIESDYYFGGAGADSITGGDGNDHIYGNTGTSVQGAVDGNDTINAGAGNDYVNGNAGNDTINGQTGNDRLFGGQGNDSITGGDGNDSANGNQGNDALFGNDGNDTLRGGAGNDSLDGGTGNDVLLGDNGNDVIVGDAGNDFLDGGAGNDSLSGGLGNDTLTGGEGNDTILGGADFDSLTGGTGADTFQFVVSGDAAAANVSGTGGSGLTDSITDFVGGTDKIQLAVDPTAILYQDAGVTFTTVQAAFTAAQTQLNATVANDAAVYQVGADSYLFANTLGTSNTIDTVVKLVGVTATTVTGTDIIG